jgi:transcriptional regulator with XRE-family HTH domain
MNGSPPPAEPQIGLAKAIRLLRRQAQLSQATLAEKADLHASYLARIESGSEDPTWGDMRRVAEALGVSMEELTEIAEQQQSDQEV